MRVVLAAEHPVYAAKLAAYLRETEPGWEVAACTHALALRMVLREAGRVDVLVAPPAWLKELGEQAASAGVRLALVDHPGQGEGERELMQYQPLPRLHAAIREAADTEGRRDGGRGGNAGLPLVTVFSASGGAGKTTLALNLVRQAGERGLRTFYLNLEAVGGAEPWLGQEHPDSLTRLLYVLQSRPEQWKEEWERLCRYRELLMADALDCPDRPDERLAMTPDALDRLLEAVAAGGYDWIVADPDCGAGEWHFRLLERSRRVVWLVTEDIQGVHKAAKLFRYWAERDPSLSARTWFVSSKRVAGLRSRAEDAPWEAAGRVWPLPGKGPAAALPHISSWKMLDHPGRLLNEPAYQEAVGKLMDLLGMRKGGVRHAHGTLAGGTG
ncbi:MAG TPA: hypothetical protein VIL22_01735 [Paenibacillaceae bacterium]